MNVVLTIIGWLAQSRLCIAVITASVGFGAGWAVGAPSSLERAAELDALNTSVTATQRAQTLADELQHERAARAASDTVQLRLTHELQLLQSASKDRTHALETNSSDRRDCLRSGALRVLDGAPGIRVDRSPAVVIEHAASGAAAADAAPAAGADDAHPTTGDRSSERQVAAWIISAGEQYEECRTRLDALIDFIEMAHGQADAEVPAP